MELPITFRTASYAIDESKEKECVKAKAKKKDAATEFGDLEWHTLSINKVETRLSTSLIQGLSKGQVAMRAKEYSRNEPQSRPAI
jgi:sodium/potassium-transporting ATPase subunit alpha